MSQYVNFFIRHNDELLPIADYSRSSTIYQVMSDAPYGKIQGYSYKALQDKITELNEEKTEYIKQIRVYIHRIELICGMENNSVEEKEEAIQNYDIAIAGLKDEVAEIEKQAIELRFIANLTYEYEVYAGVEVGEPKIEDIIAGCR